MRISDWSSDVCSSDLVGIGRRLPQKGENDVETLIGMVDEDVLRADRRETVATMFADAFGETRRVSGEFEVGAVDIDERRQRREADETADLGDDRLMPLNIGTQHLGDLGGHIDPEPQQDPADESGRAAWRERGGQNE